MQSRRVRNLVEIGWQCQCQDSALLTEALKIARREAPSEDGVRMMPWLAPPEPVCFGTYLVPFIIDMESFFDTPSATILPTCIFPGQQIRSPGGRS